MKFGRICSTILIACFLASNLTACGPSAKEAAWMQKMSDLYSDDSFTLVGEPEDDSTFTEGNSIELKSAKYPAYQIIVGSANELSLDAQKREEPAEYTSPEQTPLLSNYESIVHEEDIREYDSELLEGLYPENDFEMTEVRSTFAPLVSTNSEEFISTYADVSFTAEVYFEEEMPIRKDDIAKLLRFAKANPRGTDITIYYYIGDRENKGDYVRKYSLRTDSPEHILYFKYKELTTDDSGKQGYEEETFYKDVDMSQVRE